MDQRPHPDQITHHCSGAVILNERNEVLLLLRDDMPLWTNTGGNADPGEDFETTMRREIMEEVGIEVDILRLVGDFFAPLKNNEYGQERLYLAKPRHGQVPKLGDEGTHMAWFAQDALPDNMGPRYRLKILKALENVQEPVSIIMAQSDMLEFLEQQSDFSRFTGIEEWKNHPIVTAKRRNGQLRFDPPSF